MGERRLLKCQKILLDFFERGNSTNSLEVILDIYDEIRCLEMHKKTAEEKLFRVLYNIKESRGLDSILEKQDIKSLNLLLDQVLEIRWDGEDFYIKNRHFSKLTLDELHRVLIETMYLMDKENTDVEKLPI